MMSTMMGTTAIDSSHNTTSSLPEKQLTSMEWTVVGLYSFFIPLFILSIPPIVLVALTRFDIVRTKRILFILLLCTPVVQIMHSVMILVSFLSLLNGRSHHDTYVVNEVFYGLSSTCLILLYSLLQYQLLIILGEMNRVCKVSTVFSERTYNILKYILIGIGVVYTFVELPLLFGINIAYGLVETYANTKLGMTILYSVTGVICVTLAIFFIVCLCLLVAYTVLLLVATKGDKEKRPQAIRAVIYGSVLILVSIISVVSLLLSAAAPAFDSASLFVYVISAVLLTVLLIIFVWLVLVLYGSLSALKVKFQDDGKSLNSSRGTVIKVQQDYDA